MSMHKAPNPIHTAGPRPQHKPRIYNRPWHLDADERRHGGRRKWEVAAAEAIIELAGEVGWLYPPDFSARDLIRFRASGGEAFADLRTSGRTSLHLQLYRKKTVGGAGTRKQLGMESRKTKRGVELALVTASQARSRAFRAFFRGYARAFHKAPGIRPQ
jgi:hypothetical protein